MLTARPYCRAMRHAQTALLSLSLLAFGQAASAQDWDREPPVWPTVRYSWPEKLSFGVAVQPPLDGIWDSLLGSFTWGQGGIKAGVGIGRFGGSLMSGYAIQATVIRTSDNPNGAPPNTTFVGVEAEAMAFNISIRIGPAVRMGHDTTAGRVRLNFSVGLGF